MAEKRRGRQKRRDDEPDKPSKEEYAVAKYLRFNVPCKEGKLVGMPVQCFIASKAVDALMESKWSGSKTKNNPLFTSRASCTDYCHRLLEKGMYHRALKVERRRDKPEKRERKKVKEIEDAAKEEEKKKKEKKSKKKSKEEKADDQEKDADKDNKDSEVEKDSAKEEEKKEEEKKKKKERKIKVEMHDNQIFKDGPDNVYVWIYDPVPTKTFIIGLLMVLGAVGVCLFPIWPPEVRQGVYYLSVAAACFVGFILLLCVVRLILFCLVWGITIGRHHFWFLPNLTEDVGFFESFQPLYKHERMGSGDKKKDKKSLKSKDTPENKDLEDAGEKAAIEDGSSQAKKEGAEKEEAKKEEAGDKGKGDGEGDRDEEVEGQQSSNDNGFELVDPEDAAVEENEDEEGENDEDDDDEETHAESKEQIDSEPKKTR